ncbi:MAG: polysaccharide deacetylase family protein [Chitinispirillaceae bacterium]|nr:polysaccharide deacetylase family protein [Chitinispirillaceae bacterium]
MSAKKRRRHIPEKKTDRPKELKCSKCGKTVVHEEALIVKGTVYCSNVNCLPDLEMIRVKAEETLPSQAPADRSIRRLIVHSSLTIALCAVVLTMWVFREVAELRKENRILRTSRSALIEQIKTYNRESPTDVTPPLPPADTTPVPAAHAVSRLTRPLRKPTASVLPCTTVPYHFVNGSGDEKTVALTFDGGSLANVTPAILDTLAGHSVSATMFLTGHFIRRYPDITRRIVAEGHACGNHTFSHPHLTSYAMDRTNRTLPEMTASRLREEFRRAEDLFFTTTGLPFAPIWRAPYGEYNREICRWAREAGYLHIGWRQGRTWLLGLDSNDWIPDSTTPGFHTPMAFFDKVVHLARLQPDGINGGIILMHLGTQRRDPAMQVHTVLGMLIDTLRADGYRFVQIPEMVSASGIDLSAIRQEPSLP